MAAIYDKSVPTRFHFGNALSDLSHLIPTEDEVHFFPHNKEIEVSAKLDDLSLKIAELETVQSKLSFALRDLKRSIG